MATSKAPKQPPFPHPPLEVGVPQYPTPLVPDFYTKNGHIILVVKESAEKGSYNPMPLDGSVTYSGRDASKWPSTLYLVYQRPTEDSEFVYNYYANDRTLASQDPWNYNIGYSDEHPSYPIYQREYYVPRSQYAPVTIGTADPTFGGTAIITKQQMVELEEGNPLRSRYVKVQRIYETIPGPVVSGYQYDDFLDENVAISKQTIVAGTSALSYSNGLLSYKDEPIDAIKSQRIISSISSLPSNRVEYKTATHSSPTLVFSLTVQYQQFSKDLTDIRLRITPVTTAAQSRQTIQRITTGFSYGAPTAPDPSQILSPQLKDIAYTGYNLNFDLGGGLCDTLNYTVLSGYQGGNVSNPIYETISIPATSISASTYNSYIGTYKITSFEQEYWKSNIWVSRTVETYIV